MTKYFFFFALICIESISAQIDMQDSTVQVIAYWNMGDSQQYKISESELVATKGDTISYSTKNYNVNISVTDSTSFGYIIQWSRSDFKFTNVSGLDAQLNSILSDYPILLTSDEYGGNINVLNWEDINKEINDRCELILQAFATNINALPKINKIKAKYADKSTIMSLMIRDVNQFFAYHGARYKLGESITKNIKIPNNYGGDPLDATAAMVLDELLPDNSTYIIKSFQNINSQQLTAVTYDYISALDIVGAEMPAYEDFPTVTKQIWGGSEIHSPSGWIIYSQESEQVSSGEDVTLRDRVIEIIQ